MKKNIVIGLLLSLILSGMLSCDVIINPTPEIALYDPTQIRIVDVSSTIDFGEVLLQNPEILEFKIKNYGNSKLLLTGTPIIEITDQQGSACFSVETNPATPVFAHKETSFALKFKPLEVQNYISKVVIYSNDDQDDKFEFTVKGKGVEPKIFVYDSHANQIINNVGEFDFGQIRLSKTLTETFTIENQGSSMLYLTGDPIVEITEATGTVFDVTIQPGDHIGSGLSTGFKIKFSSTQLGEFSATVVIANSDYIESPYKFTIKGDCVEPEIKITDPEDNNIENGLSKYNYPDTTVDFDKDLNFKIHNIGTCDLNLRNTNPVVLSNVTNNEFQVLNQPKTVIPPGDYAEFDLRFTPYAQTSYSSNVYIYNDDVDENPFVFTIKGNGVLPEIEVRDSYSHNIPNSSGNYDFGNVFGSGSKSETFSIINSGTGNLNLFGSPKVEISGSGASAYSVTLEPTSPVAPGSSTTFTIEFSPLTNIAYTATVTIANDDSDENPFTFNVNGAGILPEIDIKQGSTSIASGSGIYDFGIGYNGYTGTDVTFTIDNIGSYQLTLKGSPNFIVKSGSDASMFIINQTMTTSPINPGNSTTFTVKFSPTSLGNKTATISIASDDADENPYTFTLKGTAVAPAPEINVRQGTVDIPNSTGEYNFDRTKNGNTSGAITFEIQNIGVLSLSLSGSPLIALSGTDVSQFSIYSGMTSPSIAGGSSTTFQIAFNPTSFGEKEATISIASNDADENPYVFKIKGLASNYEYGWTKRYGYSGNFESAYAVVTDSAENVYVAGYFSYRVNFGLDFGVTDNIRAVGGDEDIYITKINANGTYGWTKTIGGSAEERVFSMVIDSAGNLYLVGSFNGTVDFGADFGASDSRTVPQYTCFVTKINANLSYGWTKLFDSKVRPISMSINNNNEIFITGWTSGTVNFAADFGSTDNRTSQGQRDVFAMKIYTNGTYGWTRLFGGSGEEYWSQITADDFGNVYIGGFFMDTVNFGHDFSINDSRTSAGSLEVFITKLSTNGSYVWTKQLYGTGQDQCEAITTDSSGNVYVTGYFYETVNFGYDFGVTDSKTSIASDDCFVMKINANGTYGWTKCFHGNSHVVSQSITTDSDGDVYMSGWFRSTVDFGSDFGISDMKTNSSGSCCFMTKIKADGSYVETKKIGARYGYSIAVDSNKNVYLCGSFSGLVNFAEDFGLVDNKQAANGDDGFVMKIKQ